MLVLSILHSIFLTEEEARSLHQGNDINVVGVSLPIWYFRGNTSEPAEEVFCKYTLTNKSETVPLKIEKDGYTINVPQIPADAIPRAVMNDEDWRKMSEEDRAKWFEDNPVPDTSANLLPIAEKGSEYLHFKEYNKIKNKNQVTTVVHIIEIKYKEALIESMY